MELTMVAIGKKAKGMSKGYLSGIERGNVSPPGQKMAQLLAKALGIPPVEFSILCELVKLPDAAIKRPQIAAEIEALYAECGETKSA
jgi:transcriptional regulator with XRE-family HTH domain